MPPPTQAPPAPAKEGGAPPAQGGFFSRVFARQHKGQPPSPTASTSPAVPPPPPPPATIKATRSPEEAQAAHAAPAGAALDAPVAGADTDGAQLGEAGGDAAQDESAALARVMQELNAAEAECVRTKNYAGATKVQEARRQLQGLAAAVADLDAHERAGTDAGHVPVAAAAAEELHRARAHLHAILFPG